jgi:glycosyltransferase involved in cell wall biosynthesis
MKILMITSRADIGGGPKHLLDLIKGLSNSEAEVFLASPTNGELFTKLKSFSKYHFEIPHRSFNLILFIKLVIWSFKNNIEIIHSHGKGAGIYSRLMWLFGFKVVHSFHGLHINRTLKGRINYFVEKALIHLGTYYIYCSEDELNLARENKILPKNFAVVCNAVEVSINSEKDFLNDVRTIGTIARFDPVKNFQTFFNNISALNKIYPNLKVNIAGCTKDDFSNFNIPLNVNFFGIISDTHSFYKELDLYISHSLMEGMPLTILEAMSLRIPCFISDVPGHNYFIKNKVAFGFFLDKEDSFLQNFMKLNNKSERLKKAQLAYDFVSENHSIQSLVNKVLQIYLNTLDK